MNAWSRSTSALSTCAGLVAAMLLSGCASMAGIQGIAPNLGENVKTLQGPQPFRNETPASTALKCMRQFISGRDVRIGVADLTDGTGSGIGDSDVNSKVLSQRPDLMLTVALNKAGVKLVNRTSTGVAEWEMREAMAKRLGDGASVKVDNATYDYRPVRAGGLMGSTYYINGAITELNWGVYSDVDEYGIFGVTAGRRQYRVQIALDLAVTRSATTEMVLARSYAKQMVGRELNAGVFRFFSANIGPWSNTTVELFESNIGQKQNEPAQAALRWTIEAAAYDIVSEVYGRHPECDGRMADFIEYDTPTLPGRPAPTHAVPPPPAPAMPPSAPTEEPQNNATLTRPKPVMVAVTAAPVAAAPLPARATAPVEQPRKVAANSSQSPAPQTWPALPTLKLVDDIGVVTDLAVTGSVVGAAPIATFVGEPPAPVPASWTVAAIRRDASDLR